MAEGSDRREPEGEIAGGNLQPHPILPQLPIFKGTTHAGMGVLKLKLVFGYEAINISFL